MAVIAVVAVVAMVAVVAVMARPEQAGSSVRLAPEQAHLKWAASQHLRPAEADPDSA